MRKKQFKTESKKMLDMMINSVYTHKEIFLRELISNASDAIDKRYFKSITDSSLGIDRDKYEIFIVSDEKNRTLTITDNGIGMSADELEDNLSTIAKSGSGEFKADNADDNIGIIGQFGVGFYSAFMISDRIVVRSKKAGESTANKWESAGADGYTIEPDSYDTVGSEITLYLKPDTENENYSEFLHEHKIRELVKKYSDYIRYPVRMEIETQKKIETPADAADSDNEPKYETVKEVQTLNSMIPIWHKKADEVTDEEYAEFYKSGFYDYEAPLKSIHAHIEGTVEYETLLFIPARAPFDYYSKSFEKGLRLYSDGVMIMDKCAQLLPDYFNFVRGVVDSCDLTLNISRETLQENYQVRTIAKSLEKKIRSELVKMLESDRDSYEKFFAQFGTQLKFGIYNEYGRHKDTLQDLLIFRSSACEKQITLKEYTDNMPESQKSVYYAFAATAELADALPKTAVVREKGFDVLLLTDDIDEFALTAINTYKDKSFVNVNAADLDVSSDEEKEAVKKANEDNKSMLDFMKESLDGEVKAVRLSNTCADHPVNLSSEGYLSAEMARVLSHMPGNEGMANADMVLEINMNHTLAGTLSSLYETDKDKLKKYTNILYAQARQISGLEISNPVELTDMICSLLV